MAVPNPYQQYRQQQVNTASQEKLLLMLFDGAIRFCRIAVKAIEEKQEEMAHTNLIKAQDIIEELISSLNFDYEIAQRLYSLYDYLYIRLVEANMNKDAAIIDEALRFLTELRETWAEAAVKAREGMV
ncbi:MAG: flagellar export chaperone FliS [Firmicutes bacterium HGW-Firmicutes-12]|jgi:flagellar protein FliS|nr:MAG: flagellar export chaperone FliS [Firmicutes bacterium HGW-Firmicutes-12]